MHVKDCNKIVTANHDTACARLIERRLRELPGVHCGRPERGDRPVGGGPGGMLPCAGADIGSMIRDCIDEVATADKPAAWSTTS